MAFEDAHNIGNAFYVDFYPAKTHDPGAGLSSGFEDWALKESPQYKRVIAGYRKAVRRRDLGFLRVDLQG